MKTLSRVLTSTFAPGPLAVSVFSDHGTGEVVAFLHEEGKKGVYFVKLRIALMKEGMAEEVYEGKPLHKEIFRPPDTGEISMRIKERIKHFALRYKASGNEIYFYTWDHEYERPTDDFCPPPLWLDPDVIRRVQKTYDRKIEEGKIAHALKLCEEGERLLQRNRRRAALRHFRDASQIAPDFYFPLLGIGEILIQEDKWEEAGKYIEQAKRLFEKTSRIPRHQRNKIHGRIEEAFLRLRSGQEKAPASPPPGIPPASVADSHQHSEEVLAVSSAVSVSFAIEDVPFALKENYQAGKFEGLELYTLRVEAERLKFIEGFDELLAPQQSNIKSYEHQLRTARIVLRRMRGRAMLADEVGLGKTIEAGLVLKEYLLRKMISKVLVLAVPSLVSQWQDEMAEKFDISFVTTQEMNRFADLRDFWNEPFVVASLSLVKREPHRGSILNQDYDLVIVDEAHHLRNRETVAWKFVNQLKRKYLLLLTATPIQNGLEELYNLVTLLRPGQLGTPAQFRAEFMERGSERKPRNPEALRTLLREVMIRNTRVSAKVFLPRRIARTISVEFNDQEQKLYHLVSEWIRGIYREKAISRMVLSLLQRQAGSSFQAVFLTLQKLEPEASSKFCSHLDEIRKEMQGLKEGSKLSALDSILSHTDEKCLIFTEFLGTQSHLEHFLKEKGYDPLLFHGALSPSEKVEAIRRFQAEGRILISTPSGGEGTNLQFCRTLINYDLPWNPMKIEQRIGRIHRIGQTGEVFIYNLAACQTVEHYLLKILDEKLNLFELVVGEAETILGELTGEKDFEEILMDIWLEAAGAGDLESKIDALGNRILEEKTKYLETKRLDETMFKQDYETV